MPVEESAKKSDSKSGSRLAPGLVLAALVLAGLFGFVHFFDTNQGDGLIAAAIAFGMAAHVICRR